MVGAPGDWSEHAGRDTALRNYGAVLRADGDGARIRSRHDAQVFALRDGPLFIEPRQRAPKRAPAADCGSAAGIRALPEGKSGNLLPQGDDWRRSGQPRIAQDRTTIRLRFSALSDFLCSDRCPSRTNTPRLAIFNQGLVRRHYDLFEPHARSDRA